MASMVQRQADLIRMRALLSVAFNASGPVQSRDLFAGRIDQIAKVLSAVGQSGQHVVLFGERGVGKTSLASLTHEFWNDVMKDSTSVFPIRYSCTPADTFGSVWENIAELIADLYTKRNVEVPTGESWNELISTMKAQDATPHSIRRYVSLLGKKLIIVIDEFDQLNYAGSIQEFASTIKALSDYLVDTTLILVGVADTVDDLIEDYASVERALIQVRMPRMSLEELAAIIDQGYARVGLKAKSSTVSLMGKLAQGLPHYAHRFGQEAGYSAIDSGRSEVDEPDVNTAVDRAIDLTNETIRAAYTKATTSPQKGALFPLVLLACALAHTDDLGYFAAADVREPLIQTARKRYEIPQFVGHLKKFTSPEKGNVLESEGEDWSRRYRFSHPLLRPYVVLKGIQENQISQAVLQEATKATRKGQLSNQQPLF